MYDEIVKRLREADEKSMCGECGLNLHTGATKKGVLFAEAANAIENMSEAYEKLSRHMDDMAALMPRWIPVTERLPEEDGCYLVVVKNDHQRRYSKTAWFSHDSWFARQDVTHWMPLPEPPKEE